MPEAIVIVEDNHQQRDEGVLSLQLAGFAAFGVPDGHTLDRLMAVHTVDVVVLDIGLVGESGLSIAKRLSQLPSPPGIIMLTAMGALDDRLHGMQQGADGYLVKPVDPRELVATIEALRRRMKRVKGAADPAALAQGRPEGWLLVRGGRELVSARSNKSVPLTELQRIFLLSFKDTPIGKPINRDELMNLLGYTDPDSDPHRVETLVNRLRLKVRQQLGEGLPLLAVPGLGYALTSILTVEA